MEVSAVLLSDAAGAVELGADGRTIPISWHELFTRDAPVEVDLGCGDGSFLAALAQQNPDRNFLGVERLVGRVCSACRKIETCGLTNAHVLRTDIAAAVQHLFRSGSVDVFHLLLPDPWPKRRHHRRRVVTAEFLSGVSAALARRGSLHIATDQRDYFNVITELVRQTATFEVDE